MEQLVHLRLKSIYKAFKQSSRSSSSSNDGGGNSSSGNLIHDGPSNSKHAASNSHHQSDYDDLDDDGMSDDTQALLHAAAAAGTFSNSKFGNGGATETNNIGSGSGGSISLPSQAKDMVDKYMAEKEKADKAAQALLAELEEEEEAMKSKKTKKKKKKQRQQAKKDEERKEDEPAEEEEEEGSPPNVAKKECASRSSTIPDDDDSSEDLPLPKKQNANRKLPPPRARQQAGTPKYGTTTAREFDDMKVATAESHKTTHNQQQPLLSDAVREPEETPESQPSLAPNQQNDSIEIQLCALVEEGNVAGIEELLCTLKGVPGRAQLRKNAKKALKKLRTEEEAEEELAAHGALQKDDDDEEEEEECVLTVDDLGQASSSGGHARPSAESSTRRSGGLLKVVTELKIIPGKPGSTARSQAHHTQVGTTPRAECVMQMDPAVVGWVIGKGGQRIRELMDQSGAKVWIDQDNKTPQDPRTVYVSGSRQCVDHAVRLLKELVANAPLAGGANQASDDAAIPADDAEPSVAHEVTFDRNKQATPNGAVKAARKHAPRAEAKVSKAEKVPAFRPPKEPFPAPTPEKGVDLSSKTEVHHETGVSMHVLTCEPRFVPLLIGRRGWTIKHIQDSSGARVDIDQTVTPRRIRISGSESNVEVAIRLVRDVLSYPHAQLHANGTIDCSESTGDAQVLRLVGCDVPDHPQAGTMPLEDVPHHPGEQLLTASPAVGPPAEIEERNHSPLPSSLIMTGDAKSLISASSSLSSTPEPSMASSSKAYFSQLQTGPLVPPDFTVASYPISSPSAGATASGNCYLRHDMGLGEMAVAARVSGGMGVGSSPLYGGGLVGVHQGQHFGMPPHPHAYAQQMQKRPMGLGPNMVHEQHLGNFAAVPGNPMSPQHMRMLPQSLNGHLHQPTRLNFGVGGMAQQANNIPLHHESVFQDPQPQFRRPESSIPDVTGLHQLNKNLGRSHFSRPPEPSLRPALWDRQTTGDVSNCAPPQSSPEMYYLDSLRHQSHGGTHVGEALPLHFDMPQAVAQARGGVLQSSPLEVAGNVLAPVRDDSLMVDSLFGPLGSGGGQSEAQAILPGFQGLSINGGDVGLHGGAWGPSGWDDVDCGDMAAGLLAESSGESVLFAALQPHHNTQEQLHPPQSRFIWGSTKESVGQV
jgi:hypothetical protein